MVPTAADNSRKKTIFWKGIIGLRRDARPKAAGKRHNGDVNAMISK
jgi:hypothetical protein